MRRTRWSTWAEEVPECAVSTPVPSASKGRKEELPIVDTRRKKSAAAFVPPEDDKRFKLLLVTMKRHQFSQDALIEVLHAAQGLFGSLESNLLYFVAHHLKLPLSRVFGVATFYHFFTLKPKGKHTCVVCAGTACYDKGAEQLLAAVGEAAHILPGEMTSDGEWSLLTARCLGACGVAPAVVLDGAVHGPQTPSILLQQLKGWLPRGAVGAG
jgi:bidirectional [NiFe] hydrogenase diaphorase subunit